MEKLTYDDLRVALRRVENAVNNTDQPTRNAMMTIVSACNLLEELRAGFNMQPEGATYDEVLAEARKVYNRDQQLLRAMHTIRDEAVKVLQRR